MHINATLFTQLLAESQTFRNHVTNLVYHNSLSGRVEQLVHGADGKIDAIKKIRDFSTANHAGMAISYPQLEWFVSPSGGHMTIGLASSKKFVESIRSNWD